MGGRPTPISNVQAVGRASTASPLPPPRATQSQQGPPFPRIRRELAWCSQAGRPPPRTCTRSRGAGERARGSYRLLAAGGGGSPDGGGRPRRAAGAADQGGALPVGGCLIAGTTGMDAPPQAWTPHRAAMVSGKSGRAVAIARSSRAAGVMATSGKPTQEVKQNRWRSALHALGPFLRRRRCSRVYRRRVCLGALFSTPAPPLVLPPLLGALCCIVRHVGSRRRRHRRRRRCRCRYCCRRCLRRLVLLFLLLLGS